MTRFSSERLGEQWVSLKQRPATINHAALLEDTSTTPKTGYVERGSRSHARRGRHGLRTLHGIRGKGGANRRPGETEVEQGDKENVPSGSLKTKDRGAGLASVLDN